MLVRLVQYLLTTSVYSLVQNPDRTAMSTFNSAFHPSGVGKSSTSLHRLGLRQRVLASRLCRDASKIVSTILRWHSIVLRWLAHEELIRLSL